MKDFIKSLKMIKYGLQLKTQTLISIGFFAFGILMEIFLTGNSIDIISGLYMIIAASFIYQLMLTSSVSALVQTSPFRRRLQTVYPAILTLCTTLFSFTVFVIMRSVRIVRMGGKAFSPQTQAYSEGLFLTAVLAAFILTYSGFCFKNYIISLIFLAFFTFGITFSGISGRIGILFKFVDDLSLGSLIAICYAIVIVGWLLCLLLSILFYRKPIDSLAVRTALRQAQTK